MAIGSGAPLKGQVGSASAGGGAPDRRRRHPAHDHAAHPRLCLQPLNVFFCHRADGTLQAILYEVNNTFGQRHSYLIPVEDPAATPIRQETRKRFYVSPFWTWA